MNIMKLMTVGVISISLWGCATVPAKHYQFDNSKV